MKSSLFLMLTILLLGCNAKVQRSHIAVFSDVGTLIRGDSTRTGFFTNTSFFNKKYDQIEYRTTHGTVVIPNDGTQNFLACRYDTATMQPIWVATGGGKGGDGGCNYYTDPPGNAVYVMGYFEDTARFLIGPGSREYKEIISRGYADMFLAKYRYDTGELVWIASRGSIYPDVVFTDNVGARHKETLMALDRKTITVYTNFFGPVAFDDTTIAIPPRGQALQISFDKGNGKIVDARYATTLPK